MRLPVLAISTAALACAMQPGNIMTGVHTFNDGLTVRYSTRVEPPPTNYRDVQVGGGVSSRGQKIHRFVTDTATHVLVGYDLTVEKVPAGIQVTFGPLTLTPEELRQFKVETFTPAPLARYPQPQVLKEGGTISVDLFINPSTGQKVVDYLEISSQPGPMAAMRSQARSGDEPRDFRLDDVEFRITKPELLVNGKSMYSSMGGLTGAIAWLSVPDRGRFILSIVPRDGFDFRKAGVVRGNTIRFDWNGDTYEWRASEPVLTGEGAWTLYVMHDDPPAQSEFTFGTCDRVEYLLTKR